MFLRFQFHLQMNEWVFVFVSLVSLILLEIVLRRSPEKWSNICINGIPIFDEHTDEHAW